MGRAHPDDRPDLLAALQHRPDLGRVLSAQRAGGDPRTGCGVGLAIALLERSSAANTARTLLTDPDPGVRACACEAIGAIGTASTLVSLSRLLEDSAPEVRAAAALAVGRAGRRTGRQSLAKSWLNRLSNDRDPGVRAAHGVALRRLTGS